MKRIWCGNFQFPFQRNQERISCLKVAKLLYNELPNLAIWP
jgi:hypothetical protein